MTIIWWWCFQKTKAKLATGGLRKPAEILYMQRIWTHMPILLVQPDHDHGLRLLDWSQPLIHKKLCVKWHKLVARQNEIVALLDAFMCTWNSELFIRMAWETLKKNNAIYTLTLRAKAFNDFSPPPQHKSLIYHFASYLV